MERITLPGLPAKRAGDFTLDGFDPPRYGRVIYTPQEQKPDRVNIECQAFEVDANGKFVAFDSGAPSRTPGTIHTISKTGIGDTHTLAPGWCRVVGDYALEPDALIGQKPLPANCQVVSEKPTTANVGDLVYVGDTMYEWKAGMLEDVMRAKANELAGLIRNSAHLGDFDV